MAAKAQVHQQSVLNPEVLRLSIPERITVRLKAQRVPDEQFQQFQELWNVMDGDLCFLSYSCPTGV